MSGTPAKGGLLLHVYAMFMRNSMFAALDWSANGSCVVLKDKTKVGLVLADPKHAAIGAPKGATWVWLRNRLIQLGFKRLPDSERKGEEHWVILRHGDFKKGGKAAVAASSAAADAARAALRSSAGGGSAAKPAKKATGTPSPAPGNKAAAAAGPRKKPAAAAKVKANQQLHTRRPTGRAPKGKEGKEKVWDSLAGGWVDEQQQKQKQQKQQKQKQQKQQPAAGVKRGTAAGRRTTSEAAPKRARRGAAPSAAAAAGKGGKKGKGTKRRSAPAAAAAAVAEGSIDTDGGKLEEDEEE